MVYNHQAKAFTVEAKQLESAAMCFIHAIKQIRIAANLPLDKYKKEYVGLEPPDYAMRSIIEGAKYLGVELGAEWGEQLDVRGEF